MNPSHERVSLPASAAVLLVLGACSWTQQRPVRHLPTAASSQPAAEPFVAAPSANPAPTAEAASTELALPRALSVLVEASEGVSIEQTRLLYQPAPVAACKPTEPGFMRIVITSDADTTAMLVEPGSSADAATSECVLKALSVVDIDEVLKPTAADATSKVQSVLTISW